MNTESDANEIQLVKSQSEESQSEDTKEGIRSIFFDHIYACHTGQVDRPGSSYDLVVRDHNIKLTEVAALPVSNEVNEEKVNISTYQSQFLANLSEKLSSCRNENKQLKNLLLMHLDLIQQQSDQLLGKEKQLVTIKEENVMLKKKLYEMDRNRPISTAIKKPTIIQFPIPQSSTKQSVQPSQQVDINNFGEFLRDAEEDLSQSFISTDRDSSLYMDGINISTAIVVSSDSPVLGLGSDKQNDDIVTTYIRNLPNPVTINSGDFRNFVASSGGLMNDAYMNEASTIQAFSNQATAGQALINASTNQNFRNKVSKKNTLPKEAFNTQHLVNLASTSQSLTMDVSNNPGVKNQVQKQTSSNKTHLSSSKKASSCQDMDIEIPTNEFDRMQTRRSSTRVSTRHDTSICIESASTVETIKGKGNTKRTSTNSRAANRRSSTGKISASRTSPRRSSVARTSSTHMSPVEAAESSPSLTVEPFTSTNRLGTQVNRISKIYRSRSARPTNDDLDTFNDSFENRTFDHEFTNSRKPKMIHTYMSSNDGIHTTVVRNEPCYNLSTTSSGLALPYPDPYEITNDPEAMRDYTPIPKLTLHRSQQSGIVTIGSAPPKYQNLRKKRELKLQQDLEKKQIELYNESVIGQNSAGNAINKIKLHKHNLAEEPQKKLNDSDHQSAGKVVDKTTKHKIETENDDFDKLANLSPKVEVTTESPGEAAEEQLDEFNEPTNDSPTNEKNKNVDLNEFAILENFPLQMGDEELKIEPEVQSYGIATLQNFSPRDGELKTETGVELDEFTILQNFSPRDDEELKTEPEVEMDDFDKLINLSPLMDEESYSFVASEWLPDENDTPNKEQDDSEFPNEEPSQATWSETRCEELSHNERVTTLTSRGPYLPPESEVFRNNAATQCIDIGNQIIQPADHELIECAIQNYIFSHIQTEPETTRRAPPRSASMYVSGVEPDFQLQASLSPGYSGKGKRCIARKNKPPTSSTVVPITNDVMTDAYQALLEVPNTEAGSLSTQKERRNQTKKPPTARAREISEEKNTYSYRKGSGRCVSKVPLSEVRAPTLPPIMTTEAYYTAPSIVDATWYPSSDENIDFEESPDQPTNVEVPRWREKYYGSIDSPDGFENLDDAIFRKRHNKHEMMEKRLKRWDMQRIREQRHVERLLKRQNNNWVAVSTKNNRSKSEIFPKEVIKLPHTFWPNPKKDIQFIEIVDEIPVSAFGEIIPDLTESEFFLQAELTDKSARHKVAIQMKKEQREQDREFKQHHSHKHNTDELPTLLQPSLFDEDLQAGSSEQEDDITWDVVGLALKRQANSEVQDKSEDYKEEESITPETQDTLEKPPNKNALRSKKNLKTKDENSNKKKMRKQPQECINRCEDTVPKDSTSSKSRDNPQPEDPNIYFIRNGEYQPITSLHIQDSHKSIEDKLYEGQCNSLNNNQAKTHEQVTNIFSDSKPQELTEGVPQKQLVKRRGAKRITTEISVAEDNEEPQSKKHRNENLTKNDTLLLNNENNNVNNIFLKKPTAMKLPIKTLRYDTLSDERPDNVIRNNPEKMYSFKSSDASKPAVTTLLQQQLEKPSLSEEELQKKITSLKVSQTNPFVNKVTLHQPPKLALTPEEFKQKILMYSENERKTKTKLPMLPKQLQKQLQEKKKMINKEIRKKTNLPPTALNNNEIPESALNKQNSPIQIGQDSKDETKIKIDAPNSFAETKESLIEANVVNLEPHQNQNNVPRHIPQSGVHTTLHNIQEQPPESRENIGEEPLLCEPILKNRNTLMQQPKLHTPQHLQHEIHHSLIDPHGDNLGLEQQTRSETQTVPLRVPLTHLQGQSRQLHSLRNENIPHSDQLPHQVQDSFLQNTGRLEESRTILNQPPWSQIGAFQHSRVSPAACPESLKTLSLQLQSRSQQDVANQHSE